MWHGRAGYPFHQPNCYPNLSLSKSFSPLLSQQITDDDHDDTTKDNNDDDDDKTKKDILSFSLFWWIIW